MKKQTSVVVALITMALLINNSTAAVMPLDVPSGIMSGVTINFDGYQDHTIVNTLYQNQGVTFSRDDGARIYLLDWTSLGRTTTSPDNVLATVRNFNDPIWATHLNIVSTVPLYALGACFGNDQSNLDFNSIRLSAYDTAGGLIGSVDVTTNNNTAVDQFIGLRSDIPFARVRFENLTPSGAPSASYSVVLDDLKLESVPEPSTIWIGIGPCLLILVRMAPTGRGRRSNRPAGRQ